MPSVRLRYQTVEFPAFDIHLCTLRDRQEFDEPDGVATELGISSAQWPLFGVIWPGGWALAKEMATIEPLTGAFLEIGCGIALASLVLNHRGANVSAMDYHPLTATFLARNTALNDDPDIPFMLANWTGRHADIPCFDVIIASDVLYEDEHGADVAGFIDQHLSPDGEVIVADPGRGQRGRFQREMAARGFTCQRQDNGAVQFMTFRRVGPNAASR